ncbi:MAG TPA: hypothetical protein VFS21_38375 [Roseiflexaceae bacterium]|nr:hypothetical protein [Roseiflexaceae bacterium]
MTAAAGALQQQQPGVYLVGPGGSLAQQAEVQTIARNRGESTEQFLIRLSSLALREGCELEFSYSNKELSAVRATIPAAGQETTLAMVISEPIHAVLEIMQKHGFGSVSVILIGGTLLHTVSSFTALDPAQLAPLASPGDQIRIEGGNRRIARLIHSAPPPGLRSLLGL